MLTWDPSSWSTKHCVADLHQEIENLARIFNVTDSMPEEEPYYYRSPPPADDFTDYRPKTVRETELLLCIDKLQTTLLRQNQYITQLKRIVEQQQRAVEISQSAEKYLRRQLNDSAKITHQPDKYTPFRRTRARSSSPKSRDNVPHWITANTDRLIAGMNCLLTDPATNRTPDNRIQQQPVMQQPNQQQPVMPNQQQPVMPNRGDQQQLPCYLSKPIRGKRAVTENLAGETPVQYNSLLPKSEFRINGRVDDGAGLGSFRSGGVSPSEPLRMSDRAPPPSVPLRRLRSDGYITPTNSAQSAPMSPWGGAAERCRQKLITGNSPVTTSPMGIGVTSDIDAKLSSLRDLIIAARRRFV